MDDLPSRFDERDAPVVARWVRSPGEALAWASVEQVPVPAEVVIDWSRGDDVESLVLRDSRGDPVGYGELWIDDAEDEVEVAHVIVDPARRGRGVGRRLMVGLVEAARAHHDLVVLRVRPDNEAAIRCYRASGFARATAADEHLWNRDQPIDYVWMVNRPA